MDCIWYDFLEFPGFWRFFRDFRDLGLIMKTWDFYLTFGIKTGNEISKQGSVLGIRNLFPPIRDLG